MKPKRKSWLGDCSREKTATLPASTTQESADLNPLEVSFSMVGLEGIEPPHYIGVPGYQPGALTY